MIISIQVFQDIRDYLRFAIKGFVKQSAVFWHYSFFPSPM